MRLGWNRDQDGIITVYIHQDDGRGAALADFWVTPLIEKLGMNRAEASDLQQRFAEMLVAASRCKICDSPQFPGEHCPAHHQSS